jgi:hypothetical protein
MNDSPFEQWRMKYMRGTAASREIMELLALAFEGGRVAEREACAVALETGVDFRGIEAEPLLFKLCLDVVGGCATLIRSRG